MFWSKIWFFLVALAGALALTVALVLPRPAQRSLAVAEANRLQTACSVIHILLADDARNRVELAGAFARSPEILTALESASTADHLDEPRMKQVRDVGDTVMKSIQGNRKPDFAMLIDKRGRVVARVRLDDNDFGDVAAGRPLIDDALAGYLRDDIWAQNGTMYFVSAAPVVKQGAYVGAVVLGHQVTTQLAETLVKSLEVDMGFHLGSDAIAASKSIAFEPSVLTAALGKLGDDSANDCQSVHPIDVRAGAETYTALAARLPGEAGARQAFYSVLIKKPEAAGFVGTLKQIKETDLAFASFPWLVVGGALVLALVLGIGLMLIETDRPLRRLTHDAVRLAKGDTDRLPEDSHGGKFGSIARSVNIHIDKLGREAKSAKKDLDQLLGPAPEGGLGGSMPNLGTIDLLASPLPRTSAAVPPPSEFRFQDTGPPPDLRLADGPPASELRLSDTGATVVRKTQPRPGTPPPVRQSAPGLPPAMPPPAPPVPPRRVSAQYAAPPPPPSAPSAQISAQFSSPMGLEDDILGRGAAPSPALDLDNTPPRFDPYFRQIFDQFVSTKRSCNESIAGLVFERFAEKLIKNRDDLMAKTGCREVRFTVYVKDGKAALKATPVRDEV